MNLKNGNVFTSKFVGTGPSSYGKKKKLLGRGLTKVEKHCPIQWFSFAQNSVYQHIPLSFYG